MLEKSVTNNKSCPIQNNGPLQILGPCGPPQVLGPFGPLQIMRPCGPLQILGSWGPLHINRGHLSKRRVISLVATETHPISSLPDGPSANLIRFSPYSRSILALVREKMRDKIGISIYQQNFDIHSMSVSQSLFLYITLQI